MSHGTKAFLYSAIAVVGVGVLVLALGHAFSGNKRQYKEIENPDNVSFWEHHEWKGNIFSYPPDWTLVSTYEDGDGLLARKVETGFTIAPPGASGQDTIYVGGGADCKLMDTSVCVSPYPMYTNSRDAKLLSTFTYIAQHVTVAPK